MHSRQSSSLKSQKQMGQACSLRASGHVMIGGLSTCLLLLLACAAEEDEDDDDDPPQRQPHHLCAFAPLALAFVLALLRVV